MDRQLVYPGQIPLETDLLSTNKNAMVAFGLLAQDVLGSTATATGLACTQTTVPSLSVQVAPGRLYSVQNIDSTAYSSVAADTTHQILKQGILLDPATLACPAPATAGFSVVYLIEAAYQDADSVAVTLPYYNASNPTQAYSGPGGTGAAQATVRKGTISLQAKAGIAAATGTQAIPAVDAGYVALWVVTVANGQATITAPNIAQAAGAPFLTASLQTLGTFLQAGAGAVSRTVQDKLRESVSVFDSFTPAQIADVTAGTLTIDVTAAIQAAINTICGQTATTVGQAGGRLFFPPGKYLITSTLYVGYGLCMEGVWAGGYPYVSATTKTSQLYFNFGASVNQWAIDTQTFHSAAGGGGRILYNEWVTDQITGTGAAGYTATYGLSIKGLLLVDANNALQTQVPYGCLRLNGAPNSRVENVSFLGFGYGLVLGGSYGTTVRNVTGSSNYYGAIAYNANNDISFLGCQFDKVISPASLAVPVPAIPSWMASAANMVAVLNLDGSHYGSAKGLIISGAPSIGSNGCVVDVIAQYWPDTCFLNNSYSNTILNLYAEQCTGYVLTTAYASFNMVDGHNFSTSAPLPYFADFGYNSVGKVNIGGNNTCLAFWKNAWSSALAVDVTRVSIVNTSGTGGPLPANQRVTTEFEEGVWTPVVTASAGSITTVTAPSGTYSKYRNTVRLECTFTLTTNGTGAGVLQVDGMPFAARNQTIQPAFLNAAVGQAVLNAASTRIQLFTAAGGYPGVSGTTYFLVLTYLV
jgi:hypothetical protein